jgi:hypothetical protein
LIIAVDFDGVLAADAGIFPAIGPPNHKMINFIRELIDDGHEVVLWTSRTDSALETAVKWCKVHGLKFCAINDNAPSNKAKYEDMYPNGTRKVAADVYIDDHNPWFMTQMHFYDLDEATNDVITWVRRIIRWKQREEN